MGVIFRNIVYPLFHWAKSDGVNDGIKHLSRTQWLPVSDIQTMQQIKLGKLLAFCSKNVPYYRDAFSEHGLSGATLADPERFCRIPILTKKLVRSASDRLVSEDLDGNGLTANSTSGSTGEALYFYTDFRSDAMRKAAELRGKQWTGWQIGDRSISLWGSPIDEQKLKSVRSSIHSWMTKTKLLSTYSLSANSLERYWFVIEKFKPILLVSYAGPLELLARYLVENDLRLSTVKAVITSGEKLWPHQRTIIEKALGLRIYDRYGSREFGLIAQECDAHKGLHVAAERVYLEIVNDEGEPCAPGETGKILITDLDNYGAPMIRYEIGDRGTWTIDSDCRCGRGLPILEKVNGRTLEIVRTRSGDRIGGTFWTLLLKSKPGIKQFQVVQANLDEITIRYVPDAEFNLQQLEYYREKIMEKCGKDFRVFFMKEDSIDLTGSGKNQIIVSQCASDTT